MPNGLFESDIDVIWATMKDTTTKGWRNFFHMIS